MSQEEGNEFNNETEKCSVSLLQDFHRANHYHRWTTKRQEQANKNTVFS